MRIYWEWEGWTVGDIFPIESLLNLLVIVFIGPLVFIPFTIMDILYSIKIKWK